MLKDKPTFAFFGTPEVASETLKILKQAGFLPALIVTAPDKPKGRKMILTPPPVKVWAERNKIPCIQPEKIDENFNLVVGAPSGAPTTKFDLFIVVAYGKILPEKIINLPRLGSLNVHYSLLPKYRGASPVESAILAGEVETGVTIQKMVYKMDSGPIIAQEKVAIGPDEKAPELRQRLGKIGGELLVKLLHTPSAPGTSPYIGGKLGLRDPSLRVGVKQDESQATFCQKIKKEDGLVDLEAEPPNVLYNKFRAYAAWPRTFFLKNGKRIIITDAEFVDDPPDKARGKQFVIKKVLPEGRKEISWEEFKRQN